MSGSFTFLLTLDQKKKIPKLIEFLFLFFFKKKGNEARWLPSVASQEYLMIFWTNTSPLT
jgi:hypothetical protein